MNIVMKKYYKYSIYSALALLLITVAGCQSNPSVEMPVSGVAEELEVPNPVKLIDMEDPTSVVTEVFGSTVVELSLALPQESSEVSVPEYDEEWALESIEKLKQHNPLGQYTLLPKGYASIEILDGENTLTKKVNVSIKDAQNLDYGFFTYPVRVMVDGHEAIHFVQVTRLGEFTPLTPETQKPLPQGYDREKPMLMVAYVETNDWDPRNIGNFILKESKKPAFDIVIFFAANMNYDAVSGKRYLFFNKELQPIVNNPDKYIKPLTDRGIKVLIDILPNWQGVGYANFQSYEEAQEFAAEAKMWTDKIGIDGWDVDEEYASYGVLPSMPRKDESWLWFARAMKEAMPDKLLTLYDFGHWYSPYMVDDQGKYPKDYFDWSWANYWESHGSYAGLDDSKYGAYSVEANQSGTRSVGTSARYNLNNGYQLMMVFNMNTSKDNVNNIARDLSEATKLFYGEECVFAGPHFVGPNGR